MSLTESEKPVAGDVLKGYVTASYRKHGTATLSVILRQFISDDDLTRLQSKDLDLAVTTVTPGAAEAKALPRTLNEVADKVWERFYNDAPFYARCQAVSQVLGLNQIEDADARKIVATRVVAALYLDDLQR